MPFGTINGYNNTAATPASHATAELHGPEDYGTRMNTIFNCSRDSTIATDWHIYCMHMNGHISIIRYFKINSDLN